MNTGKKFFYSIALGLAGAASLLWIGSQTSNEIISTIALWNVKLFVALAGNGPLLGYDAQGNPMYEGTPVHLFFGLLGVVSSFLIYPIIVFIFLSLINKPKDK